MMTLLKTYEEKIHSGVLTPDPAQQCAVEILAELSATLSTEKKSVKKLLGKKTPPKIQGAYLYGGVGRGKSMVMDLFFAGVPLKEKRRVHFHAFMLEVHDFLHKRRNEKKIAGRIDDDLMAVADHIAKTAKLLCFDEFQVKDVADAMILGRLFTALFDRGVTVVMTSNIAPDDLYADGLQRDRFLPFIALLKERTRVFHFDGATDYRLHRIAGRKVYFWPHDEDAQKSLENIFESFADGRVAEPRDLTVKGRVIHVPLALREAAFFSFSDLCDEARSAVDYLELTRHFRVFVIADIPKMNDMKRNAVLRFITLIDTLYDNGARVVISAAAPPDQLYTGDEHAEVFRRTVSRLMEMQSKAYMDR